MIRGHKLLLHTNCYIINTLIYTTITKGKSNRNEEIESLNNDNSTPHKMEKMIEKLINLIEQQIHQMTMVMDTIIKFVTIKQIRIEN